MCTNAGRQLAVASKICGPSVLCNFLYVTLLTPKIYKWLLDFWKTCASRPKTSTTTVKFDLKTLSVASKCRVFGEKRTGKDMDESVVA